MEYLKTGFGLVTKNDPITENCNLFYAEDLELQTYLKILDYEKALAFFTSNMNLKRTPNGLYNRRFPEQINDKGLVRTMSQDEILGFIITSLILKTGHAEEIWKQVIKQWGFYNNSGNKYNFMNPGNFYSWGQLVYKNKWKLSDLFFIVYIVNLLLTVYKPVGNTSSKIMYWLEFARMPDNIENKLMKRFYMYRMNKQYGDAWLKVLLCDIYHKAELSDFPIKQHLENKEQFEKVMSAIYHT